MALGWAEVRSLGHERDHSEQQHHARTASSCNVQQNSRALDTTSFKPKRFNHWTGGRRCAYIHGAGERERERERESVRERVREREKVDQSDRVMQTANTYTHTHTCTPSWLKEPRSRIRQTPSKSPGLFRCLRPCPEAANPSSQATGHRPSESQATPSPKPYLQPFC